MPPTGGKSMKYYYVIYYDPQGCGCECHVRAETKNLAHRKFDAHCLKEYNCYLQSEFHEIEWIGE